MSEGFRGINRGPQYPRMRFTLKVVSGEEGLTIGAFASKEDALTAASEFLDFYEKNMDARSIDLIITAEEVADDGYQPCMS